MRGRQEEWSEEEWSGEECSAVEWSGVEWREKRAMKARQDADFEEDGG